MSESKRAKNDESDSSNSNNNNSSSNNSGNMVEMRNKHLKELPFDNLYHFGILSREPMVELYGDIKVVVMGGSVSRMTALPLKIAEVTKTPPPDGVSFPNLARSDRYCMFKVGPVLCVNHGIGVPSMSVMLHEIAKLVHYARCTNVIFLRTGTSGGLGVPPGTVVITEQALNGMLEPHHSIAILGKEVKRDTTFDKQLAQDLLACAPEGILAKVGKTMCCHDFYEGQARLDGAICDYELEDKMAFLKKAHDAGVVNVEMEGLAIASFCNQLKIRAGMMCCTLLDRLQGDQMAEDHALLEAYQNAPQAILFNYLRKHVLSQ